MPAAADTAEQARAADLPRRYDVEIAARHWRADDAQRGAALRLEQLRRELLQARRGAGLLARLRQRLWPQRDVSGPRGVYLWGGVGRGKTWLMDLFYDTLAHTPRRRVHFHHLMRDVHAGLADIRMRQEPLAVLARRMARRARVWCLDELHITDIADAMILGGLFEQLLRQGITLVITSNQPPGELYRDGLQRARFLPAIALLEQHLDLLHIDTGIDYRLRHLRQAPIYLSSAEQSSRAKLRALFEQLAEPRAVSERRLNIGGRVIAARRRSGGVVWFSFATLCEGARSAADFAALALDFHTVFLSRVPLLDEHQDDATRRFIALVDEFYDQGVKLIVSAAAAPAELYHGQRLAFQFQRTASRLIEMQSAEYLAREHLARLD
jgi:cell division protein ZapE